MRQSRQAVGRLLADFRHFAGRRLALLAALMLASAVAEGIGIVSLVPLLTMASGAVSLPSQVERALGAIERTFGADRFFLTILIFLTAMSLRSVLLLKRDAMMAQLSHGYDARLKLQAATRLAELGWARASRIGLSGMQSLLLTDIPRCVHAVHQVQAGLVAAILLCIQFGIAFYLSPAMALAAALVVLSGIALSWRWLRAGHRRGVAIAAFNQSSGSASFRLHVGLKSALAQGTTVQFLQEYQRSLEHLSGELTGFDCDTARVRAFAGIGAAVAAALLLIIGSQLLQLPFALLATLLILFARMSAPAQLMQQAAQGFAAYAPSFQSVENRLGSFASHPAPVQDLSDPLPWSRLRLSDVGLGHEGSAFALSGVSIELAAGEWVGIAGVSGSGKTSLADIVAGLFEPQCGSVTIDGSPLTGSRLNAWRAGLAYVGQSEMTFEGSFRDNLAFGVPGHVAEDQLWAALETVGLSDRIRAEGLNGQTGDRGSTLSGGERQRLAIARALLRRPSLIVMDEATNALDADAEEQLLLQLKRLKPRPAVLLIAHRDRPLKLCERIVRIEDGCAIAS
jgi:ATP-binding cassette subfamily C protein